MSRGVYQRPLPEERFWKKVQRGEGCWLWVGAGARYGVFWHHGANQRAHRVSWEFANNMAVPEDMEVLHRCDVPACVNPAHLFLGTQADNMADKAAKGRCADQRGEAAHTAKLNARYVRLLRSMQHDGFSQRELATAFGISQQQVSAVLRGENWSCVG